MIRPSFYLPMDGKRVECIGIKFPLTTASGIGELHIHKVKSAPFIVG